ncbi:3'-5' exonuclease [Candidatus Nomurabacteria bacterium]|nr:3'-5' exonuclease [Candidatus Nomurabacteria bacterium]
MNTNFQLIFLDTETTGNQPTDRLCQLAWKRPGEAYDTMFDKLYKPPIPISIESMAVHHITEKMVEGRPAFQRSEEYAEIKSMLESDDVIIIAHNAPFDIDMLIKENIHPTQSIDTLKLVRHFDPDMMIKRHNMQYLRYLLKLDEDIDEPIRAHDAKGDVIILELLFKRLYKKTQEEFDLAEEKDVLEKMIELSSQPALIGKFAFGKHNGKKVSDVAQEDRGYLEWLLAQKRQSDQDETDWIYTLEQALGIEK